MNATTATRMPADWRDFFALTKPGVMRLVIFTGLCGLLTAPGHIHPVIGFTAILCIALGAGGSAVLNQWWEAEIDAGMKRTANRPLPAGRMHPVDARDFGIALSVASVALMGVAVGWLAASILALAMFFAKRKAFPKVYILLLCLNAAVLIADDLISRQLPISADSHSSSTPAGARSAVTAILWSSYMLKSRRVKLTFVR